MSELMRPQFLRVRNWEKFQHYKNRRPPWVRYHVEMLDDYELLSLPYLSQLVYDRLLLLAARTDNNIPHDPVRIGGQVNIDPDTVQTAVETLLVAGFLNIAETRRSASKVIARRKQRATENELSDSKSNVSEAEAETEAEGSDNSKAEADAVAAAVNDLFDNNMTDPVVRLMVTIGDHADEGTERVIRKTVASHHLKESDLEYARSCARGLDVKNRAKVAVDALNRRAA